jgi:hypothetical protein
MLCSTATVRLTEGENHLISERDGLAVCQIWSRPDLSSEQGAKNAEQMVKFMSDVVLRLNTKYRGIIFDVRRGPPVFGPKTRDVLAALFARGVERRVPVAILTSDSATQVLQFRSLCAAAPSMTQVFENEPLAVQWLHTLQAGRRA